MQFSRLYQADFFEGELLGVSLGRFSSSFYSVQPSEHGLLDFFMIMWETTYLFYHRDSCALFACFNIWIAAPRRSGLYRGKRFQVQTESGLLKSNQMYAYFH